MFILMLLFIIVSSDAIDFEDSLSYLHRYGYLNVEFSEMMMMSENDTRYITALELYQRTYELPVDGKLNNDTVQLMAKLRCGVSDDVLHQTHRRKWSNTTLTWKFHYGNSHEINLTEMAFAMWSKHANINFIQTADNPNIGISFGKTSHYDYSRKDRCSFKFDGSNGPELAHAFMPDANQNPVEIHIDRSEKWNKNVEEPEPDEISLFQTLLHEIGHALGMVHSSERNTVMYPVYTTSMFKTTPIDISAGDISAIQMLYGKRKSKDTPPPRVDDLEVRTAKTSTTTYPDLCEISNDINTFLIVNEQLYIFHGKWVWRKKLDDDIYQSKPMALTDWLSFLPKNFTHISAAYRRPNGNLVFIVHNQVYLVNFPNLNVIQHKVLPHPIVVNNINAAVNTYTGRSLIFHSNNYVTELDECTGRVMHNGLIEKEFPGIPSTGLEGVFRYTNGKLYFFKGSNFYEFDEFSHKMIRAARFKLHIFSIKCPNIGILDQIRARLNKIWNYQRINT